MRLDKYLGDCGVGSRKDIKKLIAQKRIEVDGALASDPGVQIDSDSAKVVLDGVRVIYQKFIWLMMNKPAGVLTATKDRHDKTVLDIITPPVPKGLAPVGRLDKDTEGLLLLTNDGNSAHRLLSPKSHVAKVYYARVSSDTRCRMDESDVEAFSAGITLSDHRCLPAKLLIISDDEVRITVFEGRFHQVKRMCAARGFLVTYLRRESMGDIVLDKELEPGSYRALTKEEISKLTL